MKPNHYINNEQLLHDILEYNKAKQLNYDHKMPDSIGLAILQISEKLATSARFNGYSWLDLMKSDAIELMLSIVPKITYEYLESHPNVKPNAFSYLTFYAYRAFIDRIKAENKRLNTINALMFKQDIPTCSFNDFDNKSDFSSLNEKVSETRQMIEKDYI